MASLEGLGISGFRNYSDTNLQKIEFDGPLTLVWGKNGSGKTVCI
jgi:DNA repair exonuclease SbcCD ATPase subunit